MWYSENEIREMLLQAYINAGIALTEATLAGIAEDGEAFQKHYTVFKAYSRDALKLKSALEGK